MQLRLIEWKKKQIFTCLPEDLGKVRPHYWKLFLRRNRHIIRKKLGRQFSVNISNWTSYLNFCDMYLHIQDKLVNKSKIATLLPEPVWMDEKGNRVENET